MDRPYIICHMVTSIDGKVTGDFLNQPECEAAVEAYYQLNRDYHGDAFACGRVTMEGSFTGGWYPDLSAFAGVSIPRKDYVANKEAKFFAVAFDRHGRLGWRESNIVDDDPGYGGAHIIEVLCEDTPDAYLAYLQSIQVSYLFAGINELDLSLALKKLKELFGIKTLLLEGGSVINGAFQREAVIDELSLVMAPITAGEGSKPLFDQGNMQGFKLKEVKQLNDSALWLNYLK
jgi:riboflavin biosynthesis pyrimidine reductase